MGIIEALGLAFILLKLCGVINWPWLWVTAPLWGMVLLYLVVAFGVMIRLIRKERHHAKRR